MKYLIIVVLFLLGLVFAQKPATKPAGQNVKPVAVVVQKSAFDGTVIVLKKQLSDIEKAKVGQQAALTRIEKEASSLSFKSDSVYLAAKTELKAIYDKEMESVVVKEQATQQMRDKLVQDYQGAIKALDDAKGGVGGKQ